LLLGIHIKHGGLNEQIMELNGGVSSKPTATVTATASQRQPRRRRQRQQQQQHAAKNLALYLETVRSTQLIQSWHGFHPMTIIPAASTWSHPSLAQ